VDTIENPCIPIPGYAIPPTINYKTGIPVMITTVGKRVLLTPICILEIVLVAAPVSLKAKMLSTCLYL